MPILTLVIGVFFVNGLLSWRESVKPPVIVSVFSGDSIFSKPINRLTDLGHIPELRKTHVKNGDVEVRIWRGFGLSPLEGVLIRWVDGKWWGFHLKEIYNEKDGSVNAEVTRLSRPVSGWEGFWGKIVDGGILLLPLTPESECDRFGLDGTGYLVEINQDQTYRNYSYQMGDGTCRESKQMEEIGKIIGLEFDAPNEQCKRDEWFACMKLLRSRGDTLQR